MTSRPVLLSLFALALVAMAVTFIVLNRRRSNANPSRMTAVALAAHVRANVELILRHATAKELAAALTRDDSLAPYLASDIEDWRHANSLSLTLNERRAVDLLFAGYNAFLVHFPDTNPWELLYNPRLGSSGQSIIRLIQRGNYTMAQTLVERIPQMRSQA